jgi:hypothetical protein
MQNKINISLNNFGILIDIMMITIQENPLLFSNLHFILSELPIYSTVALGDTNMPQNHSPAGPEDTFKIALSSFM